MSSPYGLEEPDDSDPDPYELEDLSDSYELETPVEAQMVDGPDNRGHNPYLLPEASPNRREVGSATVTKSGAATVSLVTGILSIVMLCLPLSVVAIVSGNKALRLIRRSRGTVTGRGQAIAGLAMGYPMLLITILYSGYAVTKFVSEVREGINRPKAADLHPGASARMKRAESNIFSAKRGIAHGNTAEAKRLAKEFSLKMKAMRDLAFTKEDDGVSLSDHQFVTHCELHHDRCVFLVHVPSYRNFEKEAKKSLAELAWMTAQYVVEDSLEEGELLGVGLKGVMLYGAVTVGRVEKDGKLPGIETDKDVLVQFFRPPPQESLQVNSADESPGEERVIASSEARNDESSLPQDGSASSPPSPLSGSDAPQVPKQTSETPTEETAAAKPEISQRPVVNVAESSPILEDLPLEFELVKDIPGLSRANDSLTFSPDGKRLALGRFDSRLKLFDIASGSEVGGLGTLDSNGGVTVTAFTPDGKKLIAGCFDGTVLIFEIAEYGELSLQGTLPAHEDRVQCLGTSSDCRFAISGGYDSTVAYCSLEENRVLERFGAEVFQGTVLGVAFSPDGSKAVACDGLHLLMIDFASRREVLRDLNLQFPLGGLLSPDGRRFAGIEKEAVNVCKTATGEVFPKSLPTIAGKSKRLAFTQDGERLLITGLSEIKVWDPAKGALLGVVTTGGKRYFIRSVAISTDGQFLAAVCDIGSRIQVFRIREKQ